MAQKIPKDALKAYDKGLKYQEEKKLDQALISFTRSVEIFPEYFQALTARGEVQITQGKIQEAFNDFSEALKYDEDYQPALRGAGFCRLGQQNYLEAARYLVRALEINQSDAKGHLYLGMTLVHLNQPALAEQAFLQALKYDPEATISANLYLAKIYSGNNEYRPAAEALQAYLKARPDAPNAQELKKTEQEYRARANAQSKH
jgi:tetratricopeptide (TPR) repeat protein